MRMRRRTLLQAGLVAPLHRRGKRVALITTTVWKYSHGQHFIDRLLEGYGWNGRHHRPALQLTGLYVEQFPPNDLSRERARRFGVKIHGSIADALTNGGDTLAVDGVLIIAEHGEYPFNEKGQKLYPRYRFFKEVVRTFERCGRAVPVFNDKHLSTRWDEAREMVEDARRLRFPFLAGSSLPVTWRLPAVEMPLGAPLVESVVVAYGGVDMYDIHALEAAQAMSERRRGGESGVRHVHAVRGPRVWELLRARASTTRLMLEALSRSHTLALPPGRTVVAPTADWAERATRDPVAYFFEHRDGLRTTVLMLEGLVRDFTYAGRLSDGGSLSCQMYLPMPPANTTLASFFNPQMHHIESMLETGQAPYPIERTLLTTGMTAMAVESLHQGRPLATPDLAVRYQAPAASTFWRT